MKELRAFSFCSVDILLLIKVPPPITGATLMNNYIQQSLKRSRLFRLRQINISYVNNVKELGKFSIFKIFKFFKITSFILVECLLYRPRIVYFQISPTGVSFLRDFFYVCIFRFFNIKICYHLHGKGILDKSKSLVLKMIYRFAFKDSEVICVSNLLTYDVKSVFFGAPYILNNGIEKVIDINPDKYKDLSQPLKLLFLSNLLFSKGINVFLESIVKLKQKRVYFEAHIVGAEGDLNSSNLLSKLVELGLSEMVTYHGPIYGISKMKFLRDCDILIFPTLNDIWGNVILEAMQCGTLVIASNEGAISDIIDNEITGYLVDKNSSEQIVDKILHVSKNRQIIRDIVFSAREKYIRKYTLEVFEENLFFILKTILKK